MKKYLQIIIVLGGFFLLVFLKNIRADNETRANSPKFQPAQNSGSSQTPLSTSNNSSSQIYKDGTYTGSVEDAFYGYIQVQAVITGGRLNDVIFLKYPNDNATSRFINQEAMPILKSEAIQAQSANVDLVSGASDSSPAFVRSLSFALSKAK